jgi:hypothetical protein
MQIMLSIYVISIDNLQEVNLIFVFGNNFETIELICRRPLETLLLPVYQGSYMQSNQLCGKVIGRIANIQHAQFY